MPHDHPLHRLGRERPIRLHTEDVARLRQWPAGKDVVLFRRAHTVAVIVDGIGYTGLGQGTRPVGEHGDVVTCPFGHVDDRLWVAEAWQRVGGVEGVPERVVYAADGGDFRDWTTLDGRPFYWRPAATMPAPLARLGLVVTSVRAMRLGDLTEEDALAAGVTVVPFYPDDGFPLSDGYMLGPDDKRSVLYTTACKAFAAGWDRLNPKTPWSSNPFVWRVACRVAGR